MFCVKILAILYLAAHVNGTIDIEGIISIETAWKLDTNVEDINQTETPKEVTNFRFSTDKSVRDDESHKRSIHKATKIYNYDEDVVIYKKPIRVKDDPELSQFFEHVRKDTMSVFDEIRQRVSNEFQPRVNETSRIYEDKFNKFVNSTLKQKVKTRNGSKKVILNTIDTSNQILERLVNYLLGGVTQKRTIRNGADLTSDLHKSIAEIKNIEYQHICHQYNICRTNTGFADFLIDFLDEILSNEDKVLKSFNGLTEVCKYKDFKFMDKETQQHFKDIIISTEYWPPNIVKPYLIMVKNIIQTRNKPIRIMEFDLDVNKTIIVLEIIDILDQTILPNEENLKSWKTIITDLNDWNNDKRQDIMRIMQNFIFHLGRGIYGMKPQTKQDFSNKCRLLFLNYKDPE